jgi:kynurenine formamidase
MKQLTFFQTLAVAVAAVSAVEAQSWQPPSESQRCPSKWGAGDQRGSGNLMTPQTVLRAARLIRTGEVIELGHMLTPSMPLVVGRRFEVTTKRTNKLPEANQRRSNEELVITEIGQVGTQFDGFAHQTIGNSMYNCFDLDAISTRTGFTKLGIENVGFLMTRGVLIDVAGLKGTDMLPDRYEITVADLQAALKRQNITLEPADAVIINTGWGRLWEKDTQRYLQGSPGIGIAAAEWLVRANPMLVGADSGGVEVVPNPDKHVNQPIHQIMLVVNGIHLLESLKLDDLAAKRIYEFAFMLQPLKLQGATGSTVAPVAVR